MCSYKAWWLSWTHTHTQANRSKQQTHTHTLAFIKQTHTLTHTLSSQGWGKLCKLWIFQWVISHWGVYWETFSEQNILPLECVCVSVCQRRREKDCVCVWECEREREKPMFAYPDCIWLVFWVVWTAGNHMKGDFSKSDSAHIRRWFQLQFRTGLTIMITARHDSHDLNTLITQIGFQRLFRHLHHDTNNNTWNAEWRKEPIQVNSAVKLTRQRAIWSDHELQMIWNVPCHVERDISESLQPYCSDAHT